MDLPYYDRLAAWRAVVNNQTLFYRPCEPCLQFGGTMCNAGCSFCASGNMVWRPDKLSWQNGPRNKPYEFYSHQLASVPPKWAVSWLPKITAATGIKQLLFATNEPTLSYEYTYDLASLAKGEGYDVTIYTNGFSLPAVTRTLASVVDCVMVGPKASLDPGFYRRYVRADGAIPHVKRAIMDWLASGTFVVINDLMAPPHLVTDEAVEKSQYEFYEWLAAEYGPTTPLLVNTIKLPGDDDTLMLPRHATAADRDAYINRAHQAVERAQECGLHYARYASAENELDCHNCGQLLLKTYGHEFRTSYVGNRRCSVCDTVVPVVT